MENIKFSINKIDEKLYSKMLGKSILAEYKDKVNIESLRYLKVGHIGFDGKSHQGEIIVNSALADEVLEIFKSLYEKGYKIEKIKLVDDYNGDDNISMADNNSSAFNYRVIPNTDKLSVSKDTLLTSPPSTCGVASRTVAFSAPFSKWTAFTSPSCATGSALW